MKTGARVGAGDGNCAGTRDGAAVGAGLVVGAAEGTNSVQASRVVKAPVSPHVYDTVPSNPLAQSKINMEPQS